MKKIQIKHDRLWQLFIDDYFHDLRKQGFTNDQILAYLHKKSQVIHDYFEWLKMVEMIDKKYMIEERIEKEKKQQQKHILRTKNDDITKRTRTVLANKQNHPKYEIPPRRK